MANLETLLGECARLAADSSTVAASIFLVVVPEGVLVSGKGHEGSAYNIAVSWAEIMDSEGAILEEAVKLVRRKLN
ncbi:MAG: hypothetical protein BGP16_00260 [Sphingobium sp. 66-54]|nr:MAG: hypothetical protein BGP16_00260 [Sphingobium sp. 66-54]